MSANRISIVIHGGAGALSDAGIVPAKAGCAAAAHAAMAILSAGGSALDAVEAAVRVLEDDPHFNAGTGSVLTAAGAVEMDALLMEGTWLKAGAVAAVTRVANPISAARAVMETTPHVLMIGPGAESVASAYGVPLVEPSTLITPHRQAQLGRALQAAPVDGGGAALPTLPSMASALLVQAPMVPAPAVGPVAGPADAAAVVASGIPVPQMLVPAPTVPTPMAAGSDTQQAAFGALHDNNGDGTTNSAAGTARPTAVALGAQPCAGDHDTVGAVAIDMHGHTAVAVSTGGLTGKRPGRVGDTPCVGSGGYADDSVGASCTTGVGEHILRVCLAKLTCDMAERRLEQDGQGSGAPATPGSSQPTHAPGVPSDVPAPSFDPSGLARHAVGSALARMQVRLGKDEHGQDVSPGAGVIYVGPRGEVCAGHASARMSWAAAFAEVQPGRANVAGDAGPSGTGQALPLAGNGYWLVSGVQQKPAPAALQAPVAPVAVDGDALGSRTDNGPGAMKQPQQGPVVKVEVGDDAVPVWCPTRPA